MQCSEHSSSKPTALRRAVQRGLLQQLQPQSAATATLVYQQQGSKAVAATLLNTCSSSSSSSQALTWGAWLTSQHVLQLQQLPRAATSWQQGDSSSSRLCPALLAVGHALSRP
jgi:hypothetical protein